MKIITSIVSEDGTPMTDPRQGFIVEGNIWVSEVGSDGKPHGGLIGHNFDECGRVFRLMAFTKKELLDVLGYTTFELDEIVKARKKHERTY